MITKTEYRLFDIETNKKAMQKLRDDILILRLKIRKLHERNKKLLEDIRK